jgi:FtsP/CotA-like multicopper oxidase with cupredoxin domain
MEVRARVGRIAPALICIGAALVMASGSAPAAPELVRPNSNAARAGLLRNGVLTVTLEAKPSLFAIYGPHRQPMVIEAFAEPGKAPEMPGPLVRVPAGTAINMTIRNSLSMPLTFLVPTLLRGGPDRFDAMDSIVVQPGADGVLTTRATTAGNYVYRATLPTGNSRFRRMAGVLAGALIVDSARTAPSANERVLVMMATWDPVKVACADTAARPGAECDPGRVAYTINGRSWPTTERVAATVGDSLHWRVLAAADDVHPMHLHGFYYRIDAFSAPFGGGRGRPALGQLVVTQLMTPFSGMSMTWSPDRPGNWLFHCHFALHLQPDSVSAAPDDPHRRDMVGLVIGVNVAARSGVQAAGEPAATRHLRLIAIEDSSDDVKPGRAVLPSMHFLFEDGSRRLDAGPDFSPQLELVRGEPVAITIENHMTEPTSVHWHGIEVEDSYVDGAPGFSGTGTHLAPAIAPGDSFIARFTPPRSGTFMYHAHVDDNREQSAGLVGTLIVREPGATTAPDDHAFFLKSSRLSAGAGDPVEINGQLLPDTVVLHEGRPARLRLLNLSAHHNSAVARFQLQANGPNPPAASTTILQWRPLAKDGMDLPASAQGSRPAEQVVSIGETYDVEFTPDRAGTTLHLLVWNATPPGAVRPLIDVPIRVK